MPQHDFLLYIPHSTPNSKVNTVTHNHECCNVAHQHHDARARVFYRLRSCTRLCHSVPHVGRRRGLVPMFPGPQKGEAEGRVCQDSEDLRPSQKQRRPRVRNGSIPAASTSPRAPSFPNPSTPCTTSIDAPKSAMSTSATRMRLPDKTRLH